MRVEPDDPTGDWTREGVFEVDSGVYRIPLPLPHDGLRAVNVYAIRDSSGVVLIDSGWPIAADRDRLERALAALDCGLGDIRKFLITHVHRDHYSLAVALRREFGGEIALGAGEQPTIARLNDPDHRPMLEHAAAMARNGADELAEWIRERAHQIRIIQAMLPPVHRTAKQFDRSGGRFHHAGDHAQGGGFSRSVLPEETVNLSPLHRHVHAVHGGLLSVLLRELMGSEHDVQSSSLLSSRSIAGQSYTF